MLGTSGAAPRSLPRRPCTSRGCWAPHRLVDDLRGGGAKRGTASCGGLFGLATGASAAQTCDLTPACVCWPRRCWEMLLAGAESHQPVCWSNEAQALNGSPRVRMLSAPPPPAYTNVHVQGEILTCRWSNEDSNPAAVAHKKRSNADAFEVRGGRKATPPLRLQSPRAARVLQDHLPHALTRAAHTKCSSPLGSAMMLARGTSR